jgi:hypothetical protein
MNRGGDGAAFLIGFLTDMNGASGKTRVFDIFIHDELVSWRTGVSSVQPGEDARPALDTAFEYFLG